MLDEYVVDPRAIARHMAGIFSPYIDGYVAGLDAHGYARHRVQIRLSIVSNFGRWLTKHDLSVGAVSEETLAEFCSAPRQPYWVQQGGTAALRTLLEQLRSVGIACWGGRFAAVGGCPLGHRSDHRLRQRVTAKAFPPS
jgi:hypothetical protein